MQRINDEILVCNNLFKYSLVPVGNDAYDLICTPCQTPTAVYDVARIQLRQNGCSQITYYQCVINSTCVEIIQDCTLEGAIRRCIMTYFANMPCIECNNPCGCGNSGWQNNWF